MTITAVDLTVCPDCGGQLMQVIIEAAALMRAGGYGALKRTVDLYCTAGPAICGWMIELSTQEVRP